MASGDGKSIAFMSRDLKIRRWEWKTGRPLSDVTADGDDSLIVLPFPGIGQFATKDGSALVFWDAVTGKQKERRNLAEETIWSAAVSKNGQRLALGTNQALRVYDLRKGKAVMSCENAGRVHALSDQGTLLASVTGGQGVNVWDVDKQKCRHKLAITEDKGLEIESLTFDGDGRYLAVGTGAGNVLVADTNSGEFLKRLHSGSTVHSVALSAKASLVAAGCLDGVVYVWDRISGKLVWKLEGGESPVSTLLFLDRDEFLATGSWAATVNCWNLKTGKCQWTSP
jgi:WD40 repeat protein